MHTVALVLSGLGLLGSAALLTPSSPAAPSSPATIGPLQTGGSLPQHELVDFTASPATDLDDFFGQTVLLEFFAYW